MKCVGYIFLLCGLMNSMVWGQPAPKNQPFAVVRCEALSCSVSVSSVIRKANPEVKLGTFISLPTHSVIRRAKRPVMLGSFKSFPTHSVVSRGKHEAILGAFKPLLTVPSVIRTNQREVKLGTFKSFPATSPRIVLWHVSQL